MQKRSHKLLAHVLLTQHRGFDSRFQELAFLFGSFQPDCNPFSYLKGSLYGRKFLGHTFPNSRRYIRCNIFRLQRCRNWHIRHYYRLGKLTHYLADAFTYSHAEHFPLNPHLHHHYETQLRHHLAEVLSDSPVLRPTGHPDLSTAIDTLYSHYLAAPAGIPTDTRYILHVTGLAMTLCPSHRREAA